MISDTEADFIVTVRVVAGFTCILSILGACLIILTYAAFKDLRTLARQQLVNLSVADIIVAASHFIGLATLNVEEHQTTYENQQDYNNTNVSNSSTVQDNLCRVQGGFTMFGTLASFFWTLALGFYMLMIIVLKRPDVARYLLYLYYPICWGIPFSLTMWFALVKPTYLGFGDGADIAWCYIRVVPNSEGGIDRSTTVLAEVLGYELWFYSTVVGLAAIYITMLCYLKITGLQVSNRTNRTRSPTDLKLIFVPLIFFLLRLWSAIIDIIHFSTLSENRTDNLDSNEGFYALVLLAGIGDSAQGLANSILFCVLTKQVRDKLTKSLYSWFNQCCLRAYSRLKESWSIQQNPPPLSPMTHVSIHGEATTMLDGESLRYNEYAEKSGRMTSRDKNSYET